MLFNFMTDQLWKGGAIVASLVAVGALAMSGVQTHRLDKERATSAQLSGRIHEMNTQIVQREHDAQMSMARAHAKVEEEREMIAKRQVEIGNAKLVEKDRALADAWAAADASRRMLNRVQAEHQSVTDSDRRATGARAAGVGPSTEPAGGMCTQLLSRMDTNARLIAAFADSSSISGSECEQHYDALKPVDTKATSEAN